MKPSNYLKPFKFKPATWRCGLAVFLIASLGEAQSLQWDNTPATAGIQDGSGTWSNLGTLTNWWNGSQNVSWTPGAIATIGSGYATPATAATITLTNPIVAGGLVFANSYTVNTASTAIPVYTITSASVATNLVLTGNPAAITLADNISFAFLPDPGVSGGDTINASVVAAGGLQLMSTAPGWQSQLSLNNATNYLNGTLEIGTPGTTDYGSSTALQAQFNSSGLAAGALNGCTNLIIHTNAGVLLRGTSGAYTLNWPKNFTVSGDGIPSSFFCFGAVNFAGNTGCVFPANIQLAGDSTVILTWGNNNAVVTNTGIISGTGRLRLNQSANRPTTGSAVVLKGVNTYVGNTIIDGGLKVQLASGASNRLPVGTVLQLGDSGQYYAPNSAGTPQSSFNGYGGLVLGDVAGTSDQTVAGLTSDTTTFGMLSYVAGGNSSANSTLTVGNSSDDIYIGTLGGASKPASDLTLLKSGNGTLYLNGTNLCGGGYTINGGALSIGDGINDYPLTGSLTNNGTVVFNVASSRVFGNAIAGNGTFSVNGPGALTLTGTNTGAGAFNVQSSGVLVLSTLAQMPAASLSIPAGSGLQFYRPTPSDANSTAIATVSLDSANLAFNLTVGAANGAQLNAGTLINNGNTSIQVLGGVSVLGTYHLIHYSSYQSNSASLFTLVPMNGVTATIQNDPVNNNLDLVVTALTSLTWSGQSDGNWDASTLNWLDASASPTTYAAGDIVTFNDSATGPTAIFAGSDPMPQSILVSNVTKAYSFSGSGISSSGALIKQGGGALTVAVNLSNLGGTQIQGGSVQVGDGTVDGNITSPVLNNGALVFNAVAFESSSNISGSGAITKNGPGQLTLGGANSYAGVTAIQQGSVYVESATALGATTNSATVQPGAELWLDVGGVNVTKPLSLGGFGITGLGGAFNASANAANSVWNGAITVTTNTGIYAANGASLTFSGPIAAGTNSLVFGAQGNAAITVQSNVTAQSITLSASGGLSLGGSNHLNAAAVTIPGSGLLISNPYALGTNGVVALTNNTTAGTYTVLTVASNIAVPNAIAMSAMMTAGSASPYRVALHLGVNGDSSNSWNGPISITSPDAGNGLPGYFYVFNDSGNAFINGPITETAGNVGYLQFRGASTSGGIGYINGNINVGTNWFTVTTLADGLVWVVNTNQNTWGDTHIFNGRLGIGANNALPVTTTLYLHDQGIHDSKFDLMGYNQQVAGLAWLDGTPNANETIVNSSTNRPSTLTYNGGVSVFPLRLSFFNTNSQPLNLNVAGGTLVLSNMVNDYTGTTVVQSGATLGIAGSATLAATPLIDVQSGATLDLSTATHALGIGTGQTLAGGGTVLGSVTLAGTLSPGDTSNGALTINGNLTNQAGSVTSIRLNKSLGTNDTVNCTGLINYGGTLALTNLGGALTATDSFHLITVGGGFTGNFSAITGSPGSGLVYAFNPTNGVLSVVAGGTASNPTNITFTVTGNSMTLAWPADHLGWFLQSQVNQLNVGLSNNWVDVIGSDSSTQAVVSISASNGAVFYRLRHP